VDTNMAVLTAATVIISISNEMLPDYRGGEGDAGVGRRICWHPAGTGRFFGPDRFANSLFLWSG